MSRRRTFSDDFEDNESLNEPLLAEEKREKWDVFENNPIKINTGSTAEAKWFDLAEKIAKVVSYIVTFFVVLGCAVISKGTLLFITSQILPNKTRGYCNKKLDINRQYEVTVPDMERAAWIWILIFIFWVPQIGTFIRSVRICLFKSWKRPNKWEFLSLIFTESLPTIGSAILVFTILPNLDVVKGVMLTNAVCFIPAFTAFISRNPDSPINMFKMVLDIISLIIQASAFVLWPLIQNKPSLWLIPVSLLFISIGWWENYVSDKSPVGFIQKIGLMKKVFENNRYYMYVFISLWKCILFFCTVLLILWIQEGSVQFLFDDFIGAFQDHSINISEVAPVIKGSINFSFILDVGKGTTITSNGQTPIWVFLINITSTYICYAFAKFACKTLIQRFSFAFPLNLSVPISVTFLVIISGIYNTDMCSFYDSIPPYLFFETPPFYYLKDFILHEHTWIWVLWLLSQTWITFHIWTPKCEKLARTEKLFVRPMFDPYLIDQDVALNRRQDDKPRTSDEDINDDEDTNSYSNGNKDDYITRIYACGTMWHETSEEMMEFLKSVLRLDEDQHARRIVREVLQYERPDYYELETHILFDDAFIRYKGDPEPHVNQYVKQLISAVDAAASEIHEANIRVRPPKKYETPYGGRLVWTLPGKTKMIAHLKDKKKIRAKKRWSQVMYMYYLLGHKLMEDEELSEMSKDIRSKNTYILALDGDIDFQPAALHLLIDLMKKNSTLGAACGRIHPIGTGPMVWYQMFEYAVGHWLQKATEHVIGCVLCSPGCFSLFRGEALMDENVMAKYTTESTEAMHYVQYDQGEDRWLCTLLLQRGYRVEYSAASDAYTHCPEKFGEFYNQRRRWMPSTTANILDLLMDYKRTVKINDNISVLYIIYQIVLMVGTILGPGTIFLMLVGAFVAAFQMDQWSSFLVNCIPILIFMFVCFVFKKDSIQLFFAGLLSAVYGLVMMAVLVGVMLQISNDGPLAPSSLFFFCVAGEFIITAILHPKEINCLPYGIVYYVTVPSMYMLLVIYSVFNMNVVSWGTREVTITERPNNTPVQTAAAQQNNKKPEENKFKNKIISLFGTKNEDNAATYEVSLAGLFKCLWCTHRQEPEENQQLIAIKNTLDNLVKKLDRVEAQPENIQIESKSPMIIEGSKGIEVKVDEMSNTDTDSIQIPTDNWIEDEDLLRGEIGNLSDNELTFWKRLLEKYLYPLDDSKKKEKVAKDLMDLRDKAVFAFFMLNSLFVLVVFLLTLKKDLLHIKWPLDVKHNITYTDTGDDVGEIIIMSEYLELEPIGFVFLIFFALLLIVQFIGMLVHRFGTFNQILANTNISFSCFTKSVEKLTEEEALESNPIELAKQLHRIRGVEEDDKEEKEESPGRRKTVHNLLKNSNKKQTVNDLDQAFRRRTAKLEKNYKGPLPRKTIEAFINRRQTIMHRQSQMRPMARPSMGPTYFHYDNIAYDEKDC